MKILLATDGSDYSKEATRKCIGIISVTDPTTVKIISIVEPMAPTGIEPFGVSTNYFADAEKEAQKNAEDVVKAAKEMISSGHKESNLTIETEVFFSRSTKGAIVEEAQKWGADLIVLGSHGYGLFKRLLLGSVSDAVVRYAPCSVLVVRKPAE